MRESITQFIEGKLFVNVNKEKALVSNTRGVKYIDYSFYVHKGKCQLTIHPKVQGKEEVTTKRGDK